jgi:3'-phosphoadenosine 5'-phosphosulfate sulfotransferase (PAPS reductase)/FAD synthetase
MLRRNQLAKEAFEEMSVALSNPIQAESSAMSHSVFQQVKNSLRTLYLEDKRPWLVGFSGGKDSTMLASLVFDTVLSFPADQRTKPISVVCTDTRVEIPAIVEMVEGTLGKMQKFAKASLAEHGETVLN